MIVQPAPQLHQLLYWSRAVDLTTTSQVNDILNAARFNNARIDVTGFLLFDTSVFIQLLEGKPEALEETFTKISNDQRHRDVRVIHRGPTAARTFSAWFMAYQLLRRGEIESTGGTLTDTMCRSLANQLLGKSDPVAAKISQYIRTFFEHRERYFAQAS